jgi:NitT/TauT family transport system permease protein
MVFLVAWEALVRILDVRPFVLQPPSRILAAIVDDPGLYARAAAVTTGHALVGLAIGLVAATAVGAVSARWRLLELSVQPVLIIVLVTPWVSYFVSLVIWLGPGNRPVITLVGLVTFPVLTFAVTAGLRSADPAARELLRSVDARPSEVLLRLRMPSALPTVFSSMRYAIGLALAAAYFGEGGNLRNSGLGSLGRSAANFSEASVLWATIGTTALLGVSLLMALTVLERLILHWHVSQGAR